MIDLEKEIATVSNDAIEEEQYNANVNYSCLERERRRAVAKIPYPEVENTRRGLITRIFPIFNIRKELIVFIEKRLTI